MPADLLAKMRDAARRSNLSIAEVMRQSMSLGLPSLLKQTSETPIKPFSAEECRLAYRKPNPEFDALEHHRASLPKKPPEE
jgi:hypothetical protein